MKGKAEESSNWNLKQGRKKKKRWWTANIDWLYLVPHSTCTPCGWVPHFHKSLGLHLTRKKKKKHLLPLHENTKHEEYCIMPLSCRHSYVVTHAISIHTLICCIRTVPWSITTRSISQPQCKAKPIKSEYLSKRQGANQPTQHCP